MEKRKPITKSAFTLIELLVVVAIIGILAAVGVVAYNGYTLAAKKNAVKSQHNSLVKLIKINQITCETTGVNSIQLNGGWHVCLGPLYLSQGGYVAHIINEKWKNPFKPSESVVVSCPGRTGLSGQCCINGKNYLLVHSCLNEIAAGSPGSDSIMTNLTD